MDWLIGITVATSIIAFIAIWRLYCIKKDVYKFADQMEQALDQIISGKIPDNPEEVKDTLWGKSCNKLKEVHRIWMQKEADSILQREQLKSLISDISHQTKTPIANIKLYVEFLGDELMSKKGKEFLGDLENQTDKLDFLLHNMIKMSRLEAGSITIKSGNEDLYKTLCRAVGQIVPFASKKHIELSVECEDEFFLQHDVKWTEEAIFNILDNAVKYTPHGGRIDIAVTRQEIFSKISIRDSGKGILLERQAQIFTRFYREPEVHDIGGVGIGLYLARRILELQNGYIEVHSEAGKGSEFCLYLPNR